jgi:O6-methylguanine-DNA--protein-cysteine methyltransferase
LREDEIVLKFEVPDLSQIDEALRGLYEPTETGAFRLQISGYMTTAELRESKQRETEARKAAETRLRELEAAQSGSKGTTDSDYKFAQEQAALAKKIPESLRAHPYGSSEYLAALAAYDAENGPPFIAKLGETTAASQQAHLASLRADLERVTLERVSHELAAKLIRPGCDAMLLIPHIAARLEGREEGGVFSVHSKDAADLDALAEQFRTDNRFERIIKGASQAEKALHAKRVAETLGTPAAREPLTRAKFEALSPERRAESARAGVTILDG